MSADFTEQFFEWMESHNLSRGEIAPLLEVDERSLSNYRSRGLPRKKIAAAERLMREYALGGTQPAELNKLNIPFTDEEYGEIAAAAGIVQAEIKDFIRKAAIIKAQEDILRAEKAENILTFPEIPLIHAAAGQPVSSDIDSYEPTRELGRGRFAVQLHGDSMAPRYRDGQTVIMRERESLKNPVLKKGQIYLFDVNGEKTVKVYNTRPATKKEIEAGLSYHSADGTEKVRVLQSLNPSHPEIIATEPILWLGWLDKADN